MLEEINRQTLTSPDLFATEAAAQSRRNDQLLEATPLLGERICSRVVPFRLDPATQPTLAVEQQTVLSALEKVAAKTAIRSLASLARANDIDHLGGGLELIPSLLMTLSIVDYERRQFAIEHGHTSIGYYAALSAIGFLPEQRVIDGFRRSLDIAGHVSWVPGGTQLNSGRLGVMMPVATGLALALKANFGQGAGVICHCGDAGWISGQALNGLTAASLHRAPVVFVMHRNGIQLSGPTHRIMNKDPRPVVASLGIEILEIRSLHERAVLYEAYAEALRLASAGRPALIIPTGYGTDNPMTVEGFGELYGIPEDTAAFAREHHVDLETRIWVPGSLMSFRDARAMLECVFLVNGLPGGEGHHDGGMKGRDEARVLANPMLRLDPEEQQALDALMQEPRREVVTVARPRAGSQNLVLTREDLLGLKLPDGEKWVTARVGSEAAYVLLATKFPEHCFFVSCDLDPSTRVAKAVELVQPGRSFELGIQEQAAALLTNGLSFGQSGPQLNVFSTFTAFIEGIAREGFEFWRYQRNLNGKNEGLNVLMHLSHVGACTGRDHFSGWSLDWVSFGLGYLPYLRRFYAPADARAAFLSVKDAAAETGGHILAIPRDSLPILKAEDGQPIWSPTDEWSATTVARHRPAARIAVLALGAPAFLAVAASDQCQSKGIDSDVFVVNGFPVPEAFFDEIRRRYRSVITIEDGLIGTPESGLRGFAALVSTKLGGSGIVFEHLGIIDPQVAPSEYYLQVWEHFGLTASGVEAAVVRQHGGMQL